MTEVSTKNYQSKLWRLQNLFRIKTKDRKLVPFRLNRIQKEILKSVTGMNPVRSIVLKSRQVGVSTLWLLYFLDDCLFRPQTTSGILCHKLEGLTYLMHILKTALDKLPKSLVEIESETRSKIVFKNGSQILLSLEFRATSLSNLHISEMAFCEPARVEASLAACGPQANITIESTANGLGDTFYEMFQSSKEGRTGFVPYFAPWFRHDEYQIPLNGLKLEPTEGEKALGLSLEQLNFRRTMRARLKDSFGSEFPENEQDAFFASGSNFFNIKKIGVLLKESREWDEKEPPVQKTDTLTVWEKPQKGHRFVIGADPAEGLGGDYSCFKILCCDCHSEAASFRGHVGVDHFAKMLDEIGRRYNNALIAVERNNHGHAVNLALNEVFRYGNLYSEQRLRGDGPRAFGWLTTSLTKPLMLDQLKQGIEGDSSEDEDSFQPTITVRDSWLLNECLNFRQDNGKLSAPSGKHDDMVMSTGIAFQIYLKSIRKVNFDGILVGQKYGAIKEFGIPTTV